MLAMAISPAIAQTSQSSQRPNIVIIYPDDLGYGDIGINGHPGIKTPNLDKMGVNGMRFTNYYSASPASTASRYSLLTGRYPIRSGFGWVLSPDSERGIHRDELTLAEALQRQGYATAIFGKWHLGSTREEYLPLQNGFDEWVGFPYSNDMIPPKYPDIPLMNGNEIIEYNPDQSQLTRLYTDHAISFIERHQSENFFVYVPYAMSHVPLHPGKEFEGRSERGIYGDVVEEIDWNVGRILNTLKVQGLDQNTIVWFMSDNGPWLIKKEEAGSAGLFRDGKGSTWEGGVRVPCFVWWPGHIAQTVNESHINAMDVYATCITLAGGKIPGGRVVDGVSIAPYFSSGGTSDGGISKIKPENTPFFYYGIGNQLMAVRKGPWKLHVKTYSQLGLEYFDGKLPLLFNLHTDPSEKYDLADRNPEVVSQLLELIDEHTDTVLAEGNFWDGRNLER